MSWLSRGEGRIKKERGGDVTLALDPVEAAIIRDAFVDLMGLLSERAAPEGPTAVIEIAGVVDPFAELETAPKDPPDDPALARLLPDGYRDDPQAAADFRRFTERDLVAGKQANIRRLLGTISDAAGGSGRADDGTPLRLRLDHDALQAWLYALNDLRLALGTRLEIEDGYEERLAVMAPDDPLMHHFALYEWLTGLQDALVRTQL